jgi:glycosyltransferase involved in cell wall biosynthesis
MKVSVIIPVYNKADYVETCLSKALSQDFDDYEVIAVDDGSKDQSGIICDEMAKKDSRLRVIHTQNGGVTAARRRGVEEARGRFIMFCDSDDHLLPHALRNAYEAMTANDADEVIAPFQNQWGHLVDSKCRGKIEPSTVIKDFLAQHNNFPPIWSAMFRRDIILDGCLDIPRYFFIGEDILFHIRYLTKAKTVVCIGQSIYVYFEGLTSYPEMNLQYEQQYDEMIKNALQPMWSTMEPFLILRQLKSYEKFIDMKQFSVYNDYYYQLEGRLDKNIPLADRIVFALPPRLSYYLIHAYKWWLQRKSKRTKPHS